MPTNKWTLVGTAVAATAALSVLSVSPALAVPKPDKDIAEDSAAVAVDPRRAPDAAAGRSASSPSADAALATIQRRIATYVAHHGTRYTWGSWVDSATGTIVVETDAPDDVVTPLTNPATSAADAADAADATDAARPVAQAVRVRRLTIKDTWHRRDDIPPFYGGGGLSATGAICSSGYAVRTSAGSKFMVTAGHCYANGTTVRTESLRTVYGTVSARRLPTVTGHPMDVEIIGGSSYAGRIFTGGVTSTSSARVVAAGAAVVGYNNYCHSGRTTGEQCGHRAISVNAQVCTATGCKWPVIAYTGGVLQQPGDSGGTFYAKDGSGGAWIRGHVIAGSSTTGYIEPWTVVASALGVSIVTG